MRNRDFGVDERTDNKELIEIVFRAKKGLIMILVSILKFFIFSLF